MPALHNNAGRSKIIRVLLIVQVVFLMVMGILLFAAIDCINDQQNGALNQDELMPILIAIDWSALMVAVLNIFTVIFFIRWFKRAYYNIHQIAPTKYAVAWAAGAWFVPLMNLIRPKQIMIEIWQKTQDISMDEKPSTKNSTIQIWWNLFILGHFLNSYAILLQINATTIEDVLVFLKLNFIALIVFSIAAIAIFSIIHKLVKFENALYANRHEIDITDHLIG